MTNQINISYFKTQIGELIIGSYDRKICILNYLYKKKRNTVDNRIKKGLKAEFVEQDDEIISKAKEQISQYLQGERKEFDLPIIMVGTSFQMQVWSELLKIPYGETASYLDIAKAINKPGAVRAVANANGANAISLIIPCHRIIESSGGIGGYGGGINVKKRLLEIERE